MKAVERLKSEHDLIERALNLLEKAVVRIEAGQVLSNADDDEVTTRFSQVEQERGLTGWHATFADEVASWETQLR